MEATTSGTVRRRGSECRSTSRTFLHRVRVLTCACPAPLSEEYFARQGQQNASRREDLPPSQGGKYAGFGSGGVVPGSSLNQLGSRNVPRLDDFATDPGAALSKGWGFMSAALGAASRTINEVVVAPALEAANDPNLQSSLGSYAQRAAALAAAGARAGTSALASGLDASSDIIRRETGYNVGDLGASAISRATGQAGGRGGTGGYNAVGSAAPEAGGEVSASRCANIFSTKY